MCWKVVRVYIWREKFTLFILSISFIWKKNPTFMVYNQEFDGLFKLYLLLFGSSFNKYSIQIKEDSSKIA